MRPALSCGALSGVRQPGRAATGRADTHRMGRPACHRAPQSARGVRCPLRTRNRGAKPAICRGDGAVLAYPGTVFRVAAATEPRVRACLTGTNDPENACPLLVESDPGSITRFSSSAAGRQPVHRDGGPGRNHQRSGRGDPDTWPGFTSATSTGRSHGSCATRRSSLWISVGNTYMHAMCLVMNGRIAYAHGDLDRAQREAEQAGAMFQALGNSRLERGRRMAPGHVRGGRWTARSGRGVLRTESSHLDAERKRVTLVQTPGRTGGCGCRDRAVHGRRSPARRCR